MIFLTRFFASLLASLPLSVLYLMSDAAWFLVYHLLGYKKKAVAGKLRAAFPDKSEKELELLCRSFYHNFADMAAETLKTLKISREDLIKRVCVKRSAAFDDFLHSGKSAIVLSGHFANCEWAEQALSMEAEGRMAQIVYLKIRNRVFNTFMAQSRTRFGNRVVKMEQAFRQMLQGSGENCITFFLADLAPPRANEGMQAMFLNRMTPFFTGPEKIARKMELPVYYMSISKTGKGHYEIDLSRISENAAAETPMFITEQYIALLEKNIRHQPEIWMWV